MRRHESPLGSFGEAAVPVATAPLTVGELTRRIAARVDGHPGLTDVLLEGEVTEAKLWHSGHLYFTLADEASQIQGVMWSAADRLPAPPRAGDRVLVKGSVTVYQRRGHYQLVAREIRPSGVGAAALALEALRRRLQEEGLFAEERKRPLPTHPRAVGVVTSLKGAVLHDVLDVSGRRNPAVPFLVCGVRVQGENAPAEIAAGIRRLGASGRVDVLLVARGGGSADDLSAFNDEAVVRAVATCPVPVVSAVGHETDVTLTDFAADVRAPTPSAAAEIVVPARDELRRRVDDADQRLRLALERAAESGRARLDHATSRLAGALAMSVERARTRLAAAAAGLDAVSPLATLARGYAVVVKGDAPVASAKKLKRGDAVTIRFQDGKTDAEIR